MSAWINTTAIAQILAAGLILGAGLPALFSLGVRLNAEGVGVAEHGGTVAQKNPALVCSSLHATSSPITRTCTSLARNTRSSAAAIVNLGLRKHLCAEVDPM